MATGKKQISFDLDTKALKTYYPSGSWKNAYEVIRRYMVNSGFNWLQGSVYVSQKPVASAEVTNILDELIDKNPWLNVCMRDCRETNIGREHSKNYLFDKTADIKPRESVEKDNILSMLEDVVRSDKIENDFDFGDEELEK